MIKAENRAYLDNVGDYLYESLLPAAKALGHTFTRIPCELLYHDTRHFTTCIQNEIECVNSYNPDLFMFFSNWVHRAESARIARWYSKITCKKLFWSREDPNHFKPFLHDAMFVDVIGTSDADCVQKYQKEYPGKKVICLPMAVEPTIFYPSEVPWEDREYDIVFLGNRYTNRFVRTCGEQAVVRAAARWALQHGKKMGVWGYASGIYGWDDISEVYKSGIYQGCVDRLKAADVYRNARVALSVASNDDSPTMAPNRVPQAAMCGCVLINYKSPATEWMLDGNNNTSLSVRETEQFLKDIFSRPEAYLEKVQKAQTHILQHHTFAHRLNTILEAFNG
jgi:spore maturation protein CgeB